MNLKEKEQREQKELLNYVRAIEQDKLYYFCLAYLNKKEVLIIKAPSEGAKNKKFLGYEWSGRKGDEGIKYITSGNTIKLDDEAEALEQILNLSNIQTLLYNPKDKLDESKINTLIAKNFSNEIVDIPKELESFVSKARVVDMLDFSRKNFNKAIGLNTNKKIIINSKWELVKIENIIKKMINGSTPLKNEKKYWNKNDILWLTTPDFNDESVYIYSTSQYVSQNALEDKKVTIIPLNSVVITCTATIGKVAVTKIELTTNQQINSLVCNLSKVIPEYLAYFMKTQKENLESLTSNSGVKHINMGMLNNYKIPLPPLNIQNDIIKECEIVDDEVAKANEEIEKAEKEIISTIDNDIENEIKKLGEICQMKAGKFVKASEIYSENSDKYYPCYGGNGLRGYVKTFTHEGAYPLIGRQGALCGNITFVENKFHATEHAVVVAPIIDLDIKWLYHKLVIMNLNQYATGVAQPGLSVKNLEPLEIAIPSIKTQKQIVQKIQKLEDKISKAKEIVESASNRKEVILKKYLQ